MSVRMHITGNLLRLPGGIAAGSSFNFPGQWEAYNKNSFVREDPSNDSITLFMTLFPMRLHAPDVSFI